MIKIDIFIKWWNQNTVNVDIIMQEIEAGKLGSNNMDEEEVNPYHGIIANKVEKENIITLQMEQWSKLSNVVNCVQYDRQPKFFYNLEC